MCPVYPQQCAGSGRHPHYVTRSPPVLILFSAECSCQRRAKHWTTGRAAQGKEKKKELSQMGLKGGWRGLPEGCKATPWTWPWWHHQGFLRFGKASSEPQEKNIHRLSCTSHDYNQYPGPVECQSPLKCFIELKCSIPNIKSGIKGFVVFRFGYYTDWYPWFASPSADLLTVKWLWQIMRSGLHLLIAT